MLQDLIDYYINLLILQYNNKERAIDTIELLAEAGLMDLLPTEIQNSFSLETAVGEQLDFIGKYAGVQRRVRTLVGFVVLNDADFRSLIKIAIINNYSESSLANIQEFISSFFGLSLLVFDFKNMRMGYFFDAEIGSLPLVEAVVVNNLLPKPMGVELASTIYSNDINNFFGFITYQIPTQINTSGFNSYSDYDEDAPWLNYSDAITV